MIYGPLFPQPKPFNPMTRLAQVRERLANIADELASPWTDFEDAVSLSAEREDLEWEEELLADEWEDE